MMYFYSTSSTAVILSANTSQKLSNIPPTCVHSDFQLTLCFYTDFVIVLEKALARMVARSFMMKLPARGHQNIILMPLKNKYAEGQHGLGKFSLPDNAMKMA